MLHRVVREQLQTFLWALDQRHDERGVPLFVKREFQRFGHAWSWSASHRQELNQGRVATGVGLLTQSGSGCWVAFAWLLPGCLRQINPALRGRFGAVANRAMEQERLAKVDEARAKADWHTKVALEEGLGRTIAWYREHRDS